MRYLKNIMGLWLIQESRRQWIREGQQVSMLIWEALACESFVSFIDPDAPEFVKPGDMPARIREFCKKTGQWVPESRGEVMRCVYESLAMKYRYVFQQISKTTHRQFPVIHVVGGGTKDGLLCRLTAASCGVPVVAGPIEATVCGNVAVQLCALGELGSLQDIRRVIQASECPKTYMPEQPQGWDEAYQRFCAIVGK
ncbi:MAG: FGGY-family carbohydrate kinase [Oscillospiraceae bacterium]